MASISSRSQPPIYHRFEEARGELHERHIVRRGEGSPWVEPQVTQEIIDIDPRVMKMPPVLESRGINHVVSVSSTITITSPRYLKPEGLPVGAYRLTVYEHQFSSNGEPMPDTAPAEAVLHHVMTDGGAHEMVLSLSPMCIQRGREVAALLVNQRCGEVMGSQQWGVLAVPQTGEWVDPHSLPSGVDQMRRFIGVMHQLAQPDVQ